MRAGEEKRSKLRKTPYGKVVFKPFSDIRMYGLWSFKSKDIVDQYLKVENDLDWQFWIMKYDV